MSDEITITRKYVIYPIASDMKEWERKVIKYVSENYEKRIQLLEQKIKHSKIPKEEKENLSVTDVIIILGSGLVGALAYTFMMHFRHIRRSHKAKSILIPTVQSGQQWKRRQERKTISCHGSTAK